jgi:hypothetical protein
MTLPKDIRALIVLGLLVLWVMTGHLHHRHHPHPRKEHHPR